jgi:hypothetical protein
VHRNVLYVSLPTCHGHCYNGTCRDRWHNASMRASNSSDRQAGDLESGGCGATNVLFA